MSPEKPTTFGQRTLKILNAPFTLWLLSAIFLSIGGTYYATFQQCHREFDQFKERYDKIANEYYFRRQLMASHFAEAKSVDDVKAAVSSKEGLYSEFRGRPLYEIADLFDRVSAQIEFETILSRNAEKRMSEFQGGLNEHEGLFVLADGELPAIKANDLPNIRKFGMDFSVYVENWSDLYIKPSISAQCRSTDIFKIATGQPVPKGKAVAIGGFTDFAAEYVKRRRSTDQDSETEKK